jgi:phosphoribosylformylglycinamidine cyclo-ligase
MVNGLDLAGAALGVQEKRKVVTGDRIAPGDLILGVPSSGIHSNGLTLARRIAEAHGGYGQTLGGAHGGLTLGEELLKPTRIYREALRVCEKIPVHGMCHITGGGLLNFLRLSKYGFEIDEPLEPQFIFHWLQQAGNVSDGEMYRTFNMGMGFAFIVPGGYEDEVMQLVPDAKAVGKVVERHGVWLQGMEVRWG